MYKKVSIHNPSDTSCVQNKNNCCSICKSTGKSIFVVCKTGQHVICNDCKSNDLNLGPVKNLNNDFDYIPEKGCTPSSKKEMLFSHSGVHRRDMCSGDHTRTGDTCKHRTNNNYEIVKCNSLHMNTPKGSPKCEPETTVIYKNDKFHDDRKTSDRIIPPTYNTTEEHTCEYDARPVACPIASCRRIVTIDSLSQHFNFDHSKVPRVILNKTGPQEIVVNYSTLSEDTKCIATFVIPRKKRSSQTALRRITSQTNIHSNNKGCHLLLLMAVKINTRPINFSNSVNQRSSRHSVNKSNTPIEDVRRKDMQENTTAINKSQSENKIRSHLSSNSNNEEIFMFWLCRLNDEKRTFIINLSKEDNRQGYSYIGDAVHIRNEQDPISIYNSTDCLSLRRTAIKKLVTAENELKVIISTIQ